MNDAHARDNPNCYPSTEWTVVIEAMQSDDREKARIALENFCLQYRDVVFAFFRRRFGPEAADNYTQEFFLKKVHSKWDEQAGLLFNVKRQPGSKFRYFLASALRYFLIDMIRVARANVEDPVAEVPESVCGKEGEKIQAECDREIALGAIRRVLKRLQISEHYLMYFSKQISAEEGAEALGMSGAAFRVAAHRLKPRLNQALRDEVRTLVGANEDVEPEIRHFMAIFMNSR